MNSQLFLIQAQGPFDLLATAAAWTDQRLFRNTPPCDVSCDSGQEGNSLAFRVLYDSATLPDIMYWAKILAKIADKRVYFTAEAIKINVSKETDLEALVEEFRQALLSQGRISEIGPAEN
jgi:hypothetical protein